MVGQDTEGPKSNAPIEGLRYPAEALKRIYDTLQPERSHGLICLAPVDEAHPENRARLVKFAILSYNYDIETGHILGDNYIPYEAILNPATTTDPSVEDYLPWRDLETASFLSIYLTHTGTVLYLGNEGPYILVDIGIYIGHLEYLGTVQHEVITDTESREDCLHLLHFVNSVQGLFPLSKRAAPEKEPATMTLKVEEKGEETDHSPRDGGLKGWVQVGITSTFGAYQDFYKQVLLSDLDSSKIAWIGTFQGFLLVSGSIISGPIYDRGHFQTLLTVGSFLIVFGLMMSSLATKYWQIFLSQGLCVGLGGGCIFAPSVAVVSSYFTTKRSFTIGVMAAGGSVESTIYPIVFRKLQPQIGYEWTTRSIFNPKKARALLDTKAFRNTPYVVFSFGLFLVFVGLYIPIFDEVLSAQMGAHLDTDLSFYLLSVLNAASTFGRVIPGFLADRYGNLETIIVLTIISAVFAYAWTGISSLGGFVCFSIIYGFTSGAAASLQASMVASLVTDPRSIGTWLGMTLFLAGIGMLIGTLIAGALMGEGRNYLLDPYIFSGSFTGAGGLLFIVTWLLRSREKKIVQ
ncbi:hypothetical protein N7495_008502 [Penicillium taxi]|uniref:uncharacterized protein n=1 Tax=Penicillium taxi TaxID=168475 RepID=UPI0025458B8D|nr:uncharacterized protein N7495_008502 [Penicillium taxi]KAJ5888461.1 hypothetical protein N7495_008502 [Penicillium taxi]